MGLIVYFGWLVHLGQVVVGVLKSLSADGFVELAQKSTPLWRVTDEGHKILEKGSPELQVSK